MKNSPKPEPTTPYSMLFEAGTTASALSSLPSLEQDKLHCNKLEGLPNSVLNFTHLEHKQPLFLGMCTITGCLNRLPDIEEAKQET
jgi:hypothetical protein